MSHDKITDIHGRFQYPHNWNEITKEIEDMFILVNPQYLESKFITISFYTIPLERNPEKYPLLNRNSLSTRNRYIAMFLRDIGWIRYSVKSFMNPKYKMSNGDEKMIISKKGRVITRCIHCEAQFSLTKSEYLRRTERSQYHGLFCSKRCMDAYRNAHKKGATA